MTTTPIPDIEAAPVSQHLPEAVHDKLMGIRNRLIKNRTEAWYKTISKAIETKGVAVFKRDFFTESEMKEIKVLFDIEYFGNEVRFKKVGLR